MNNFLVVLGLLWAALAVADSYKVQMNYMQYRRNLCKKYGQIRQNFDDTHKTQKDTLKSAKELLDGKSSLISSYESNHVDDLAYLKGKTSQTLNLMSSNVQNSALGAELNKNSLNDYIKWENQFKQELNSVSLCYEKLTDQVEIWKDTNEQLVKDTEMNTNAEALSELIKSTLLPNEDCFFDAKEDKLVKSTSDGEKFINEATKNFPKYAKLSEPSSLCKDDPIAQLQKLKDQEKSELTKLDLKIDEFSKSYYNRLVEKIKNVDKKFDSVICEEIINTQKSNTQILNDLNVVVPNESNKNKINDLLAQLNEALSNLEGSVGAQTTNLIKEQLENLGSLSSKYDEIVADQKCVDKKKVDLTGRSAKLTSNSTRIVNYFKDVRTLLGSKVSLINKITSQPIKLMDIDSAIATEGNTSEDVESFNNDIETRYNIKISNVDTENKLVLESLNELKDKVGNLDKEISKFDQSYQTTTTNAENMLNVEIPKVIRDANLDYLEKHFNAHDITSFVETALKTLNDAKVNVAKEETKLNDEGKKYGNVCDTLIELNTQLNNKNAEYNKWVGNSNQFTSKMVVSMVDTASELIQSKYLVLNNKLQDTLSLMNSSKAVADTLKNEITEDLNKIDQLFDRAKALQVEYEKIISAKGELEKVITTYPKQFQNTAQEKFKSLNFDSIPQQLVIDSTKIVKDFARLETKLMEIYQTIENTHKSSIQHSTDTQNFVGIVDEKVTQLEAVNNLVIKLEAAKNQSTHLITSMNNSHQESLGKIKTEKEKIIEHTQLASTTLQTNKEKIDNTFEQYFEKYGELTDVANKKRTDIPLDIEEKAKKNLEFRNAVEAKYIKIKKSLADNRYAGNSHYILQEKEINENYTNLIQKTNSYVNEINLSLEKIPKLKSDEILAELLVIQQTVCEPIDRFISEQSTSNLNPQLFESNIEKHLNILLPDFFDQMKQNMEYMENIKEMLEDYDDSDNSEKIMNGKKQTEPNSYVLPSPEENYESHDKAQLNDEKQINEAIKSPKRSQVVNVAAASAFVVLIVFVGTSLVIFKKKNKKEYIINEIKPSI